MTLSDLLRLASEATCGEWRYRRDADYVSVGPYEFKDNNEGPENDYAFTAACSPEVVAALCRLAIVSDRVRDGRYSIRSALTRDDRRLFDDFNQAVDALRKLLDDGKVTP